MKRILSVLLAASMLLSAVMLYAPAERALADEIIQEEIITADDPLAGGSVSVMANLPTADVSDYPFLKSELVLQVGQTGNVYASAVPEGVTISWSSVLNDRATINSSGTVTAYLLGEVAMEASITQNGIHNIVHFPVHIVMPDGVYYIKNNYSGKYLMAEDGGINVGTAIEQQTKITSTPDRLPQLWKIHHVGSSNYTIRPYHKLDKAIYKSSTTIQLSTETDDDSSVSYSYLWRIFGYENGICRISSRSSW